MQLKGLKRSYYEKLIILILIIFTIHYWLVTYGTGYLPKGEVFGVTYDSLASNLLKGKAEVSLQAIGPEAFIVNGKVFTHFPPFPALFRIILNKLFPSMYGKWSRISCLLASVLSIIAFILILNKILSKNDCLSQEDKNSIFSYSLLGFGLGTPLLILISCGSIYNESRIWAFSWSVWSLYFIFLLLLEPSKLSLLLFSITSGFAITSREVYGIAMYMILFVFLIFFFKDYFLYKTENALYDQFILYKNPKINKKLLLTTSVFTLIIPGIIILCFQFSYNHARFGSIFKFIDYKYYYSFQLTPASRDIVENTGGIMNIKRIPFALKRYLGFKTNTFTKEPPYVGLTSDSPNDDKGLQKYNKLFYYVEPTIPLIVVSPWILLTGLIGFIWLLGTKGEYLKKLFSLLLLFPFLVVCAAYYVSHRYASEFFPFLFFCFSYFLLNLGKDGYLKNHVEKTISIFKILCIISVITTILSTLQTSAYNNWSIESEFRQKLIEYFKFLKITL